MPVTVHCGACGHEAQLSAPSDVWKCNCHAGVTPTPPEGEDPCRCDHVNEMPGAEANANGGEENQ